MTGDGRDSSLDEMLKLKIAKDAFVSKDSEIEVKWKPMASSDNDNDVVPEKNAPSISVELTIDKGNVFHPGAKLFILIDNPRNDSKNLLLKHNIGENNLFEERCHVTLDISNGNHNSSEEVVNLIGSNNKFSPLCHVSTSKIGNANIFETACSVQYGDSSIGNGNVVAPLVRVTSSNDDDECHEILQNNETILYNLGNISNDGDLIPKQRQHTNGVNQNKEEVELLRKVAQKSLMKHHTILKDT